MKELIILALAIGPLVGGCNLVCAEPVYSCTHKRGDGVMRDVDCAACNDGGNAGILKGSTLHSFFDVLSIHGALSFVPLEH